MLSYENVITSVRVGSYLGWNDIRQAYKRTFIGQFWITLGTLVGVAAIGTVYSLLFNSPPGNYLPYLATGLVFWNLLSSGITDGGLAFIFSEGYIRGTSLPHLTYIVRIVSKSVFTFCHNLLVIPLVLIIFPQGISWILLLAVPGFLIGLVTMLGLATIISFFATRYRDVPQILSAAMQIIFYVTPVIWAPSSLPQGIAQYVVLANPLASVLQVMRLPWLNQMPTTANWTISTITALMVFSLGVLVYQKFYNRVAFWV